MSNVRKTTISNPEKQFLLKNLTEWTRLDGRAFDEFRNVQIDFGKDWGCCYVSLGKTRVLAQVSCELQIPNSSRPSEGILNINLELNPMGDPNFEAGRQSELSSQLNRLLEKCIKDSKAVDLESLCIKMNERVWSFRVDVNLLNHEGNILDCASIATLAALAHFRRPDVTCDGIEYKIHSIKERDPIPTVIHHYPVCMSYAIFKEGEFIVADPTLLEEGVAEAFLSVGLNGYKELCGLHLGGKAQLSTNTILEVTNKAAKRAGTVIDIIKAAVEKDTEIKLYTKDSGFTHIIDKFDMREMDVPLADLGACLDHWVKIKRENKNKKALNMVTETENNDQMETEHPNALDESQDSVTDLGKGTAELIPNKNENGWDVVESDSEESDDEESDKNSDEIVYLGPHKAETVRIPDSDSEEESLVILNPDQAQASSNTPKKKKKKPSS